MRNILHTTFIQDLRSVATYRLAKLPTCSVIKYSALLLFILFSTTFYGQGWLKSIDFNQKDFGEMTIQTPDGGYFVVGHTGDGASAVEDGFLMKLDADGDTQWTRTYGGTEYDELNHIIPTTDGNYVLFGETFNPADGGFNFYLIKVNARGDILWEESYGTPNFEKGIKIIQTSDGGYAMVGFQDTPGPNGLNHNFYMVKVDENGQELWADIYGGDEVEDGFDLIEMPNGDIIFIGTTGSFGAGDTDFLAVNYSATGVFQWMQTYGGVAEEIAFSVAASPTGGLYLAGITNSFGAGDYDIFLVETDAGGNQLNAETYGGNQGEWGTHIAVIDDAIILAGSTWSFAPTHDIYLLKLNFDGSVIWSSVLGEDWIDGVNGLSVNEDNEILISGTEQSFDLGLANAFLIKSDPEGQILTNHITGKVFFDTDESCDFQNGEKEFARWIVKAEGNKTYYDITDEQGNFNIRTDTSTYILTLIPPNDYWQPCDNEILIPQTMLYDTTVINFANQVNSDCDYLEIDVSTDYLIPCESSVYYVTYCNYGKNAAAGEVLLELDEFLNYQFSTIPFSNVDGQNYTFLTPSIEPGDCGEFEMTVQLDCDVLLGKTHSVNAHILPNEICTPPSVDWDGSDLTITGECVGDSTIIILKNEGDDVDDPQPIIIVEDQIIARSESVKLNADETVVLVAYPAGKMVYAEAKQSVGHPGKSFPSVAIEGCGAAGGPESLGFVTQYPEDDADFFRSFDCQESQESFSTQTRMYPKGVGTQQLIPPNRDIEYHVLFQNTGQDTLTHLAIRDTLSSFLDWTTLRPGASSHPYEVDFSNDGVLKFAFENLDLPVDSFGFVKFRLSQQPENVAGSIVANEPAMSLDFTTPNTTNAVAQTVQNEFMFDIFNVNLCWSETFGGISYTEDAVLFSPVDYMAAEWLTTTYIDVHPTYEVTLDTAVAIGSPVNGIAIFSDTTLVDSLLTWMNCDSTITTQITVFTNTNNFNSPFQNLMVFPNPVNDFVLVNYELLKPEFVEWTLYNSFGRPILKGKSSLQQGKTTEKINISNLNAGVYYLKIAVGEEWIGRRIVKQ